MRQQPLVCEDQQQENTYFCKIVLFYRPTSLGSLWCLSNSTLPLALYERFFDNVFGRAVIRAFRETTLL